MFWLFAFLLLILVLFASVVFMPLPKSVQEENDPVLLKMLMNRMAEHIEMIEKENDKLRTEKAKKDQLELDDELIKLRKLIFERGREKRDGSVSSIERDKQDQELLLHSQALIPAPEEDKKKQPLHEETEVYRMSDEELLQASKDYGFENPSSDQWEEIKGLYDESTEVTIIERKLQKTIIKRAKYRRVDQPKDDQIIITAPGPEKLLPGCHYSIDFAVQTVADKYQWHMPFERQRKRLEVLGLKTSTKTLFNLSAAVAVHLEPVVKSIKQEILSQRDRCPHIDETPWPIGNSKESNGYFWVLANQAGSYYQFEPSRSGDVAREILKGYEGPVVADGFSGYNKLKKMSGVSLAHCWSHARREFFDIRANYPEVEEVLDDMDQLFHLERKARDFEELGKIREVQSKPLTEKMFKWLVNTQSRARSGGGLSKAIKYVLKRWEGLTLFLKDTRVALSNNEAERTIRHAVVGRKNSYGSRTINGADVAATLYSVIESCKKVELDPRSYIKMAVKDSASGNTPPTPLEYAKAQRLPNS